MNLLQHLVIVAALVANAPASAANLLVNGDFASNIDGWTTSATGGGSVGHIASEGSPALGALVLAAAAPGRTAHAEQCVVVGAQAVDAKVRTYSASSTGTGTDTMAISSHASADCSGASLATLNVPLTSCSEVGAGWFSCSSINQPLPATTQSALVAFDTMGNAAGTALFYFDHIQFGPTGTTPVSLQSFTVE